jgi:hypothetical protein
VWEKILHAHRKLKKTWEGGTNKEKTAPIYVRVMQGSTFLQSRRTLLRPLQALME